MEIRPEKARTVVLAATALHNFLIDRGASMSPPSGVDSNETSVPRGMRRCSQCFQGPVAGSNGKVIRNKFANYFMTDGQVSWQWKAIY